MRYAAKIKVVLKCAGPALRTQVLEILCCMLIEIRKLIGGFPMEIKIKIRYLIIFGYHIFTL